MKEREHDKSSLRLQYDLTVQIPLTLSQYERGPKGPLFMLLFL